ncbi:MAG TPA: DUF2817 domain-containing protein, partial [Planctomycetota bacterium]|nr:DUF2817 domain-containing protein [Planctomycetota bacterium]
AASALGCRSLATPDAPVAARAPAVPVFAGRWETLGTSVEGRPIRAWTAGTGARRLLFLGAIHGDEQTTREPMDDVIAHLEAHPERLRDVHLVVIPVVNPDGFEVDSRRNANGVDLNRNFPTRGFLPSDRHGRTGGSEPEVETLVALIERLQPELIVTVHAPEGCVDYDGPGAETAARISRISGLPVRRLGARANSLGRWAGLERGIPTITLELRRDLPHSPEERRRVEAALLSVLETGETPAAK